MKTLIISSSLSKTSKSLILCNEVALVLSKKKVNCSVIDSSSLKTNPTHKRKTNDMHKLSQKIKDADNIIIGMGVHCYSINDNLKILLDNCFDGAQKKFFGIVCAAGGEKSYLSTMHLTQICMNEWRMIQLPRVLYASTRDFSKDKIISKDVKERIKLFTSEFFEIGKKLCN